MAWGKKLLLSLSVYYINDAGFKLFGINLFGSKQIIYVMLVIFVCLYISFLMLLLLLSFHRSSTDHRTGEVHVKQPHHQHWSPSGSCVLSPLLFSLYTNDCTSKDSSVKLLKFADDTTLIGLIQDLSCPHSPSWTALWLQWSHSDSWESSSLRT